MWMTLSLECRTVEQALAVCQEARAIIAEACMEQRKWASNSDMLKQQFIENKAVIES